MVNLFEAIAAWGVERVHGVPGLEVEGRAGALCAGGETLDAGRFRRVPPVGPLSRARR
ncbi:hypothetical protein [Streptomyces sp. NPDC048191]|uniref:hypothetical protein n=1 Tax=Streptomyces sp. NPDC048191 TaxID=3155484 RepID=UPI0033F35B96